ncbi:MAG: hypothetical protein V1837_04470 [Candidatus Woesearchaeota archaeon]
MIEKKVSHSEYKKLKRWYEEQLRSKDKQIEELKRENETVIKTAVSQAKRAKDWEGIARQFAAKK